MRSVTEKSIVGWADAALRLWSETKATGLMNEFRPHRQPCASAQGCQFGRPSRPEDTLILEPSHFSRGLYSVM